MLKILPFNTSPNENLIFCLFFQLAVNYVIKIPHEHITCQDIKAAISIDKVFRYYKATFYAIKMRCQEDYLVTMYLCFMT